MSFQNNQYYGVVKQSFCTESFNISITNHEENSFIPLHSHNRPYLCLSIAGTYEEKSQKKSLINPGTVLYRRADYEHTNQFFKFGGSCLNIEFKDSESMMLKNEIKFPTSEFERGATIALSKLIVSLKESASYDVLDIQCHEAVLAHFEEQNIKGKLAWVNEVVEYINDDPYQNISLDILSDKFQLHPIYIIRKFKEITGYKLSEYLTKIRVESSIQHLMKTKKKIGEVALENGFYDQSHFSKLFKRKTGITPYKFRSILKG